MSQSQQAKRLRGRKDHWLPQGYLKGFIAPSRSRDQKPLSCFYRHQQRWESVSPREIAFGKGYYDYADGTDYSVVTHPDSIFARLEREFPIRRNEMIGTLFGSWGEHKDFLLEFMQMMRARSPLAMQQQETAARQMRGATITSVAPDGHSISVDSAELRPLSENGVRNFTISRMLENVDSGIRWMGNMDWCLRYTLDEIDPFCTTDQALIVMGTVPDAPMDLELLAHPETVVIFPICWQACLFGSPRKFDKAYDRAHPQQLISLRADQKRLAHRFVIAPRVF
jgi:Protein of unknown function (DUF4238)